ncbi:MAG: NAD-dependent epimerase/dehydratase family protein [Gammaproteobacteria bacterium]|nr:NAD-dependent epimerase/dehydratase family protein [Gammaproteobacteria bacterium]
MKSRRQFMLSGATASMVALTGFYPNTFSASLVEKSKKPLKILFLGGTGFLGPHTVNHAIARGHQVTLFNRGRSKEGLFPDLEAIVGNRDPKIDKGLDGLMGKQWDCVIDTSGYVPRIVNASSKLLAPHCQHYLFISSISAYADFTKSGMQEDATVGILEDTTVETIDGETYGPLKAYSEQDAEKNFKGRTTVIRPGLIVGPRDRTDRYTYWPVRIAKGGEVLAPGDGKDYVQYIDVRDLGKFIIQCLEQKAFGIFNATSPMDKETTQDMLGHCKQALSSNAAFTWADTDFLQQNEVLPWGGMPVWVPRKGEIGGISRIDSSKAEKLGLNSRPRSETVIDTFNWYGQQPAARRKTLRAGISSEKEIEVLAAWHKKQQS